MTTETYDWYEREGYYDDEFLPDPVSILFLCEQDKLILSPHRIYKFVVSDTCEACKELAKAYE